MSYIPNPFSVESAARETSVNNDDNNNHSLPVPEEVRTDAVIAAARQKEHDDTTGRSSFKKSRRCTMVMFGVCILAFLAVVGFLVAFLVGGGKNSSSSTAVPLKGKENDVDPAAWQNVYTILKTYTPSAKLDDPDSAQARAANFMARGVQDYDLVVPPSRDYDVAYEFTQRYVVATMYYALGGNDWTHQLSFLDQEKSVCDWNDSTKSYPRPYFTDVIGSNGIFVGDRSRIEGGYDQPLGITCNDDGEVEVVLLPDNNLAGKIPPEAGLLEAVRHLSLYRNDISGTIPDSFQYLNEIQVLILEDNDLTGSIPDFIKAQMPELVILSLGDNNLEGPIPSFSDMDHLQQIDLSKNDLTGDIDMFDEAWSLEVLLLNDNLLDGEFYQDLLKVIPIVYMDVSNNQLTGQVPPDFYDVEYLAAHNNLLSGQVPAITFGPDYDYGIKFLSLYGNKDITGEIPFNIGLLHKLEHLDLSGCGITGKIPEHINKNTNLEYLYLGDNNYDGQTFPYLVDLTKLKELSLRGSHIVDVVPNFVGRDLTELIMLDLSDNGINGTIPLNFQFLINLRFLMLANNKFDGAIPDELWALRDLELLTLNQNLHLSGSVGDVCNSDGPPELEYVYADCTLECTCCDGCCQVDDEDCGVQISPNLDGGFERSKFVFTDDLTFGHS